MATKNPEISSVDLQAYAKEILTRARVPEARIGVYCEKLTEEDVLEMGETVGLSYEEFMATRGAGGGEEVVVPVSVEVMPLDDEIEDEEDMGEEDDFNEEDENNDEVEILPPNRTASAGENGRVVTPRGRVIDMPAMGGEGGNGRKMPERQSRVSPLSPNQRQTLREAGGIKSVSDSGLSPAIDPMDLIKERMGNSLADRLEAQVDQEEVDIMVHGFLTHLTEFEAMGFQMPNTIIEALTVVNGIEMSLAKHKIEIERAQQQIEVLKALQETPNLIVRAANNAISYRLASPPIQKAAEQYVQITSVMMAIKLIKEIGYDPGSDPLMFQSVIKQYVEGRISTGKIGAEIRAGKEVAKQTAENSKIVTEGNRNKLAREHAKAQAENSIDNLGKGIDKVVDSAEKGADKIRILADKTVRTGGSWAEDAWVRVFGSGEEDDYGIAGNTVRGVSNLFAKAGDPRVIGVAVGATGGVVGGLLLSEVLGVSGVLTGDIITGGTAVAAAMVGVGLGKLIKDGFSRARLGKGNQVESQRGSGADAGNGEGYHRLGGR